VPGKIRLPRGSERGIEKLLNERVRLERRALRELDDGARDHANAVRDLIAALGATAWTLQAHARVLRQLRTLGRTFGHGLTVLARKHARVAAHLGVEQQGRAFAIEASAALGKRVQAPAVRGGVVEAAWGRVDVRTDDVGANAGEALAALAVSTSYVETTKAEPATAYAVAGIIAAAVIARARDRGGMVVTTEMVAGFGIGAVEARRSWGYPKLQVAWDSTLDRRACARCKALHHVVVDEGDEFEPGVTSEPLHSRCRCATIPWAADWQAACDALGVGPGPRTGVVGAIETQLPSFAMRLQ